MSTALESSDGASGHHTHERRGAQAPFDVPDFDSAPGRWRRGTSAWRFIASDPQRGRTGAAQLAVTAALLIPAWLALGLAAILIPASRVEAGSSQASSTILWTLAGQLAVGAAVALADASVGGARDRACAGCRRLPRLRDPQPGAGQHGGCSAPRVPQPDDWKRLSVARLRAGAPVGRASARGWPDAPPGCSLRGCSDRRHGDLDDHPARRKRRAVRCRPGQSNGPGR